MKMKYWIMVAALLMMTGVAGAASFKVITQQASIRKDKRFFAPVVASVPFGEVVQEAGREGDWLLVRYQGKEGWVHKSAVEEQKFDITSFTSSKAKETSQDEVALAGKGFTPQVEKSYRQKQPNMRYDLVDQVERLRVPPEELQAFVQQGRLKEPGGGS